VPGECSLTVVMLYTLIDGVVLVYGRKLLTNFE